MSHKTMDCRAALQLAVRALNNTPRFDTGIYDGKSGRNLSSYALIPVLEKTISASDTVWILIIDNECGTNISAHATQELARQALYQYCSGEWDDGLDEQYGYISELSRDDVIDAYFDAWGQALDPEWYVLEEHAIAS